MRWRRRRIRRKRRSLKDRGRGERRKVCREQEVKEITSTIDRMSMSMKSREVF